MGTSRNDTQEVKLTEAEDPSPEDVDMDFTDLNLTALA